MELKEVMKDIARDIADATKTLFQSMIMIDMKYNHGVLADETHLKTDVTSLVSSWVSITVLLVFFVLRTFP